MTWTHITDPMKVVMAIRVTTTDTTHEPEGGVKEVKGVEEPLTLKQGEEERTLHPTGTGFMHGINYQGLGPQ